MLPIVENISGRHLDDNHKSILLEKALMSKEVKKMLSVLEDNGINIEEFKISAAEFEFILPGKINEFVQVEYLVLKFSNTAVLSYYEINNGGKKILVMGGVRKDNKFIQFTTINGEIEESELIYENELNKDYLIDIPNDSTYTKGQSLEKISASWEWVTGCYPGYNHCGSDCGNGAGSRGGGVPVNGLDKCCLTHDRCWANFGKNDCQCDCNLIKCANKNKNSATLVAIINSFFPRKSKCKC